ncbi:MAG: hypothetical protein MJB57_15360, partial [Gemmatimonadetes bacterium]|nr:hypothetical protein [Gemmatimonadota bacterium]
PARARLGYRNRVTFTLRRSGGRAIAGYHRLTGPRLLDVDTCPLAERAIDGAWRALRASWGRGAGSLPRGRELRLTVRGAADGSAGLYVEGGSDEGDADAVLSRVPELVSYWWRPEGASWRHLGGTAALVERWDGFDVPLRPGAFLQVNREIAPVIDRHLETELGPPGDRRIVELYAGVGLRPLRWAKRGARVTTVEADDGAVETGRDVTRRAGLAVDARHERVEAFLSGPALEADLVVVNPPRGGLSAAAVDGLSAIRAERLAYVSCDAATLARDVGRLAGAWSPVFGQPFDAFPQTGHVETVLWFEPAAP